MLILVILHRSGARLFQRPLKVNFFSRSTTFLINLVSLIEYRPKYSRRHVGVVASHRVFLVSYAK